MLNSGTNVNVCDNKNKSTPLHLAVNQGNDAGVKALLASRHCDVNCQVLNVKRLYFCLAVVIRREALALAACLVPFWAIPPFVYAMAKRILFLHFLRISPETLLCMMQSQKKRTLLWISFLYLKAWMWLSVTTGDLTHSIRRA